MFHSYPLLYVLITLASLIFLAILHSFEPNLSLHSLQFVKREYPYMMPLVKLPVFFPCLFLNCLQVFFGIHPLTICSPPSQTFLSGGAVHVWADS